MIEKEIKIALLDMNNNTPNQGMNCIIELVDSFVRQNNHKITFSLFDVRYKNEIPSIDEFDIFIFSGGPGSPHKSGEQWELPFTNLLDALWKHNQVSIQKKYAFLICHSFQIAIIHWNLAKIEPRESFSFGILPIYKTKKGKDEVLFKNLDNPFYAIDSRSYQCVKPKYKKLNKLRMKVTTIERIRPNEKLERAVMSIRFSDEIIGTQFHPEASSKDVMCRLVDENYKRILIEKIGLDNYLITLDRADDEDKLIRTQAEILPLFLHTSVNSLISNDFS